MLLFVLMTEHRIHRIKRNKYISHSKIDKQPKSVQQNNQPFCIAVGIYFCLNIFYVGCVAVGCARVFHFHSKINICIFFFAIFFSPIENVLLFHSTASNFFFVFYFLLLLCDCRCSLLCRCCVLSALFSFYCQAEAALNISIINNQPKGKRNDNIIQICFLLKCQLICICCCCWFFRNFFSFRHSCQAVDCIAFCHNKCSLGYIYRLFCFVLFCCFKLILLCRSFCALYF